MDKRKISIGVITVVIIVLMIVLVIDQLEPIISDVMQGKLTVLNIGTSQSSVVELSTENKDKAISIEEKQKMEKLFPRIKYKGKVYYTIYGKKIMEDDEYIDFSDVKVDKNLAEKLKVFTNLKTVNLYNQNLTVDEKVTLQKQFKNVSFKWSVTVLGENVDNNIETLDLSNKKIPNLEEFKKELSLLPNLKKLDMSNTNLTNEQLGVLRTEFPNTRIDWVVHLGKWSLKTDAVAFSVLIYKYDYRRMTSADIQVLKYCTELQALDLGHQSIEDISVIGDYLPNLRVLILADNKIKDITPIGKLKHLHYLELFMNDITDSTPLKNCRELVDLNISFNYRFSDISGIMDLPLLERLWLISDRISADSYKQIREKYPNVKLITTGNGSTNSGWRTHERYYAMIDMYKNNYISDVFLKYDNKTN